MKYEKRLIAYIDILGFKNLITLSESNKNILKSINDFLNYLKKFEKPTEWNIKTIEIEEDAQKKGISNFEIEKITNCTCFSDTVVISVLNDDTKINEYFSTLIANISYIGAYLLSKGLLIRGGITIGNLYHNNSGIIFGQGLIDAHELESNIASNPRIIISNTLLNKLNYPLNDKPSRYPYHQYLDRFEDGCVGFSQMTFFQVTQSWNEFSSKKLKHKLKTIKQVIINGLDNNINNPNIFSKYAWLKNEYQKLIILEDGVKEHIHEPTEGSSHHNIHYSYIDSLYYPKKYN